MGVTRTSIQDFNNLVGITSSEQEESVEDSTTFLISSTEAGSKFDIIGGFGKFEFEGTEGSVLLTLDGMELHSLVILSSKKLTKEVARTEGESVLGRDLGMLRPSRESRVPQSFLGQF